MKRKISKKTFAYVKRISCLLLVMMLILGSMPVVHADENPYISCAVGGGHSLVLKNDGTVWSWGANSWGQLGNGKIEAYGNGTVAQIEGLSGITEIQAGNGFAMALKNDGTVWVWGTNGNGQLNIGIEVAQSASPLMVSGLSDVTGIAAGYSHCLALKSDGSVWAWGNNTYGQAGSNAPISERASLVQVSGLDNITAITAGYGHSMALKSDGTIWTWGANGDGQLGYAPCLSNSTPVQVNGLPAAAAVEIYAAGFNSAAILDGSVWVWGSNGYCQLGLNSAVPASSNPVNITGLSGITDMGGTGSFLAALKNDGTVWSWGQNNYGQLGIGQFYESNLVPQQVALNNITDVSDGISGDHSLAIKSDGTVWAWGYNAHYQLGDGTHNNSNVPLQAVFPAPPPPPPPPPPVSPWRSVSAAYYHAQGIANDGSLWGWGQNSVGQIGDGTSLSADKEAPIPLNVGNDWSKVVCGDAHSLALKNDGTLWAWGSNNFGQVGIDPSLGEQHSPVKVGSDTDWVYIAAGYESSAAIKSNGTLWTWGRNDSGRLGLGDLSNRISPTQVIIDKTSYPTQADTNWRTVSIGSGHTLGVKTDGSLWAWGTGICNGYLGAVLTPVKISTDMDWTAVAAGEGFSLALKSNGTLWTWGDNQYGIMGVDPSDTMWVVLPNQVGAATDWAMVEAGVDHVLAIKTNGTLWAWGNNYGGQLGTQPIEERRFVPTQIGSDSNWVEISAGSRDSFARKADGALWSWGQNNIGQLGDGTKANHLAPAIVIRTAVQPPTAAVSSMVLDKNSLPSYGGTVKATVTGTNLNAAGTVLKVSLDGGATKIGTAVINSSTSAEITFNISQNNNLAPRPDTVALCLNGNAAAISSIVTVEGALVSVSGLTADDSDNANPGVDGRDFHAVWTPSASTNVTSQELYILPSNILIDTNTQQAVAVFNDNTTGEWTGTAALTKDSLNNAFAAGSYRIYILTYRGIQGMQTSTGITVLSEDAPALAIATAAFPNGKEGTAYSSTLAATGGTAPYSWAATGLPAGLSINAATGEIHGTPSQSGTFTLHVTVTDGNSTSCSKDIGITISQADSNQGNTPVPTPASTTAPPKPTAQVLDSEGSLSKAVDIRVDNNTGTASIQVDSDSIANAFSKSIVDHNGTKTIKIDMPKVEGAWSYEAILPAGAINGAEPSTAININTEAAAITVPGNMLDAAASNNVVNASVNIARGDKSKLDKALQEQIGTRPLIELSLKIDGKQTSWSNSEAPVSVSIAYKPTAEELKDPEHITVWYIDGAGNISAITDGRYDMETGRVNFTTTHFSSFVIVNVHKTFKDIADIAWANKQIEVLASKGILKGSSDAEYSPTENITRADYLYFLIRTLDLDASFEVNFADVKEDAYYYMEIGIAKKLGITTGVGNNRFEPNKPITRQDMIVLTARALSKYKKLTLAAGSSELDKYSDKGDVASYAVNSMEALVREGMIEGSGNRINPLAKTTRAEAAVLLYRIYNKY